MCLCFYTKIPVNFTNPLQAVLTIAIHTDNILIKKIKGKCMKIHKLM